MVLLACGQTAENKETEPQGQAGTAAGVAGASPTTAGGSAGATGEGGMPPTSGGAGGSPAAGAAGNGSVPCTELMCLPGSRFVYRVTGDGDISQVGTPLDLPPETAFTPVDGPQVLVEVSADGSRVMLDAVVTRDESGKIARTEGEFLGKLRLNLSGGHWYLLDSPVSPAGRFVVLEGEGGLVADYSIFGGSADPVRLVTRGPLTPVP